MKAIFTLQLVIAVALGLMLAQLGYSGSSLKIVGANVVVPLACPFAVNVAVQPTYSKALGIITANYQVFTIAGCTQQPISGFANLTYTNTLGINSLPVNSGTLTNTPSSFSFNINLNSLSNSAYDANVGFSGAFFSNFSVEPFHVLNPQNAIITNFAGSSQVNAGASDTFSFALKNDGQLASGPISVNLVITGPTNSVTTATEGSLSPGQSANSLLTVSDAGDVAGTYSAAITGNFFVNGVNTYTNTQTFPYTVVTPSPPAPSGGGGGGGPPPTVAPVTVPSNLQLTTAPLFVSAAQNTGVLSQLGITNPTGSTEIINLSVSKQFAQYVMLSATSVTIKPGQSLSITILFNSQANGTTSFRPPSDGNQLFFANSSAGLPPGTYIVPVTLTVSSGYVVSTQVEYFTFSVTATPQGQPSILNQINIVNGTNSASGTVKVINNYNYNLTNVTLDTMLPLSVAKNISSIMAYGIQSRVFSNNQSYVIEWDIGTLPAGQAIYGYYNINKPQNQYLLKHVQSLFQAPSPAPPQSVLRLIDIKIPTFFKSTTGSIITDVLYTGAQTQNVTFTLQSASSAVVSDPLQTFRVSPNQVVSPAFNVTPSSTGTSVFTLIVSTGGANLTYSLPALVLAKPPVSPPSTSSVPQQLLGNLSAPLAVVGFGTAVFIAIAIIILKVRAMMGRPRYSEERIDRLIRMKNRIERSDRDDRRD